MQPIRVIIEKHLDGYVAYPVGIKGIVVGEGNSYEEALAEDPQDESVYNPQEMEKSQKNQKTKEKYGEAESRTCLLGNLPGYYQ